MTYTSATDVKAYLDISATDYDNPISKWVADADVAINSALDIDGFSAWEATETIERKAVSVYRMGFYSFILKNFNVLTIEQFNETAYTGTKSLTGDYTVKHGRQVLIKNLDQLVDDTVDAFGLFEVTYTYGYETIPADIKLLAKLRAAVKFRKEYPNYTKASTGDASMANVQEYQLGDERIKFMTPTVAKEIATDELQIERILAKYRKPHVIS